MSYRDDLEALRSRHSSLTNEAGRTAGERDDAKRALDEAEHRARLPVLDNIRVASPCSADWAKMSGDDKVRACADCQKNVYNLSDMTRAEAEALIIEKEGKLCIRYFQRADGRILLKDCEIGAKRKRKRRILVVASAAMLAGAALSLERASTHGSSTYRSGMSPLAHPAVVADDTHTKAMPVEVMMGAVAPPDVTPHMGVAVQHPTPRPAPKRTPTHR